MSTARGCVQRSGGRAHPGHALIGGVVAGLCVLVRDWPIACSGPQPIREVRLTVVSALLADTAADERWVSEQLGLFARGFRHVVPAGLLLLAKDSRARNHAIKGSVGPALLLNAPGLLPTDGTKTEMGHTLIQSPCRTAMRGRNALSRGRDVLRMFRECT